MMNLFWVLFIFCLYRDEVFSYVTNFKTPEKIIYNLDDIDELFKEFTEKYNKKYETTDIEYRRKVFTDNIIKINQWNREQPDSVYGINPFTDLTFDEFAKTHTGVFGNLTNDNVVKYVPKGMAPDSLDWRESNIVTGVKNQQTCGSCYIFSAIGNIESQYAKQHGQLIELSEQQSLDCNSNGCGGGWPHDVMQGLVNKGCMKESDYPYENQQGQCRTDQSKIVVTVSGGSQLSVASEDELKDAVANYGPLSIVVNVNQEWMQANGAVIKPTTACNEKYHAILLIGYGTEWKATSNQLKRVSVTVLDGDTPYWLFKNSWGTAWNEAGYGRLIRGQSACNIGFYAASATVA